MAISSLFDHFSAVRSWAATHQARARLDLDTFQLEIRCANRYFHFYPQFSTMINGRLVHVGTPPQAAVGFGGWRPYRSYQTPLSLDKRLFKAHFAAEGLSVPAAWAGSETPTAPYIVKQVSGSFGYGILGPFRPEAGMPATPSGADASAAGTGQNARFAEQFIEGRSVKLWLWGARPIFAAMQEWPTIEGDGISTIDALMERRLYGDGGASFGAEQALTLACASYQGFDGADVLPAGRTIWVDFRYGRTFRPPRASKDIRNALPELQQRCGEQLQAVQTAVANALRQAVPAPVVCSIDAVLDSDDRLWWLELNSNPIFPHHGYDVMLSEIFERPAPPLAGPAPPGEQP